jgi:hypothetical protein
MKKVSLIAKWFCEIVLLYSCLFQPSTDVPLLVYVDGGGRRHQRGLLRHRQEEVLRHQLLVRLRQVENLS